MLVCSSRLLVCSFARLYRRLRNPHHHQGNYGNYCGVCVVLRRRETLASPTGDSALALLLLVWCSSTRLVLVCSSGARLLLNVARLFARLLVCSRPPHPLPLSRDFGEQLTRLQTGSLYRKVIRRAHCRIRLFQSEDPESILLRYYIIQYEDPESILLLIVGSLYTLFVLSPYHLALARL